MNDLQGMGEMELLPVDAALLEQRIAGLRERSAAIALVVQHALEESAETTHDNAPYDAAKADRDIVDKQIIELEKLQGRSVVVEPPAEADRAAMGTIVTLLRGEETEVFEIAGDWHDRHAQDGHTIVSRRSPLALKLLGKEAGDRILVQDDEEWEIASIEPIHSDRVALEVDEEDVAPEHQEALDDWRANRLLFVAGPHASGKTELVRHALGDDFRIIDTGPLLREIHAAARPELSFTEWVREGEAAEGKDFTNNRLLSALKARLSEPGDYPGGTVIIGHRSFEGITHVSDNIPHTSRRILYINATKTVLLERYKMREGMKKLTAAEFDKIIEADMRAGLYRVANQADAKILNLDGLETSAARMRAFVDDWRPDEP